MDWTQYIFLVCFAFVDADVSHILTPPPRDDGLNEITVITRQELSEPDAKWSNDSPYMYNRPKVPFSDSADVAQPKRIMRPIGYYMNDEPDPTRPRESIGNDANANKRPTAADSNDTMEPGTSSAHPLPDTYPKMDNYIENHDQQISIVRCTCTPEKQISISSRKTNQSQSSSTGTQNSKGTPNASPSAAIPQPGKPSIAPSTKSNGDRTKDILPSAPYPYARPGIPFDETAKSTDRSREELEPNRLASSPDNQPQKLEDFEGYSYDRPKNPMQLPNGL